MSRFTQLASLFAGVAALGLVACTPSEFVIKRPPPKPKQFSNANAVTLLKHVKIRISGDGSHFVEQQHVQLMPLNQLGLKETASAKIDFHPPYTKVSDIHTRIVRNAKWYSKRSEYPFPFREGSGRTFGTKHENGSAKLLRLPGGHPGAVKEYRFTRCGDTWLLNRRFLQGTLPTYKVIVEISAPSSAGLRAKLFKGMNELAGNKIKYTKGADPNDGSRILHRWVGTELPAAQRVVGAPHAIARRARVVVAVDSFKYGDMRGSQRSWNDIAAFYSKSTGYQAAPSANVKKLTGTIAKGSNDDKLRSILGFLKDKVRTVPTGLGLGHWAPQSADFTLRHRYGDVKAKATLAIAMLAAAGIKASPILIRTNDLGPIDKSFPANVFSSVVLHTPGLRQKFHSLTSSGGMHGFASSHESQADGLLVQGNSGKAIQLAQSTGGSVQRFWTMKLVRKQKRIQGTLRAIFAGSASASYIAKLAKGSLTTKAARMGAAKRLIGLQSKLSKQLKANKPKVTKADIKKLNASSVVWNVEFDVPMDALPKKKLWVPTKLFAQGAPSAGKLRKRTQYPVMVRSKRYIDSFTFKGWTPIEVPGSKSVSGKHINYSLKCNRQDLMLQCKRDFDVKSSLIPVAQHDAFRTNVRAVQERDHSLIVLFAGSLDKDKDGTPDDKDRCPTIPGPKENKGCPDTDGDKIVDIDDKCPNLKGLPNTKDPSKHGCPKVVLVKVTEKEIKILQKIFFAFGRARIRKKSYPILDQVAAVLDSRKKLRVRIEGHTDNVGSKRGNLRLSDRRAAAVRKYLVKKGVDKERLESKGYGMGKPLVPNTSKKNRAKNRRVQFSILKPPGAAPATDDKKTKK